MAIAITNTAASTAQTSVSSTTLSFNNNGQDVLVGIAYRHSSSIVPTVTYNGVSMVSKVSKTTSAGSVLRAEIFYLTAATTGTNDIVVTWNGTISDVAGVYGVALTGVDQTTPQDASATGGETPGLADPRSTSITTVAPNAMVIDVISDRASDSTVFAGQTQIMSVGTGDIMAGSYKSATTAGAYTMKWDPGVVQSIEDWAHAVISLRPAIYVVRTVTGQISSATSGNITLNCTGGDLVVVGWSAFDTTLADRTASTVTVGGASATIVAGSKADNTTSNGQAQLAYYTAPATGNQTVTLTMGGTCTGVDWYASLVAGAKQSGQPDIQGQNTTTTGTSCTVTVTTVANNALLFDAMNGNVGPMTPNASQTSIMNLSGSTGRGSYKETTTAGSYSMIYTTGGNDDYALGVISISPAVSVVSGGKKIFMTTNSGFWGA